jgi:hypothetical protein
MLQHLFCAFLLPLVYNQDADVVVGLRLQDRVVPLKTHVRRQGERQIVTLTQGFGSRLLSAAYSNLWNTFS